MKTIAWSIPVALAFGSLLGFWAGPVLATAGVTVLGLYLGLIMILQGCYLATTCQN